MTQPLTPTETEYAAHIQSSRRTTEEMMERFSSRKRAVYQMLRSLRLKQVVYLLREGGKTYWETVDDPKDLPPARITEMQQSYLEYMYYSPRSTRDMMHRFKCSYESSAQIVRTLRMMGYAECIGRRAPPNANTPLYLVTDAGKHAWGGLSNE